MDSGREQRKMKKILGHICPGGTFPDTIRKFPSLYCSLCELVESGQFEIRATEKAINKHNEENWIKWGYALSAETSSRPT
jgi:hypothetical protein